MTIDVKFLDSIKVKVRATHFNYVNKNSVFYTDAAVNKGAKSWTAPYPKPKLVGHDKSRDPIGRIVEYKLVHQDESSTEPPDYVELTANITDKDAMEKILDGRYLTVSVGSRTSRVICSECKQIITEEGLCEHKKGTYNEDGKLIYWLIDQIDYVESSFVNDPADEFARIDQIDIGTGWTKYKDFLDNRENILALVMEDEFMKDAKLSAKSRNELPDSAFCYVVTNDGKKVRKFPAHDAAHVRNGLARLSQAKLSDNIKKKVLACLKRKAKRFGVKPSESDNVQADYWEELDPLYRMDDEVTEEEMQEVQDLFKEDPNFDLLEDEIGQKDTSEEDASDKVPASMKKAELVDYVQELEDQHKKDVDLRDGKITKLEDELQKKETILLERENEVNKFLDDNALLEKQYKEAIIANIVDLKLISDETLNKDELVEKYTARSLESLKDSLEDLRPAIKIATDDSSQEENQVTDPTAQNDSDEQETQTDQSETANDDPFAIFAEDNSIMED